jgi:hypothetical protein
MCSKRDVPAAHLGNPKGGSVSDLIVQRRAVLLVPLLAPFLTIREAAASKLDPTQTMFTLPQIPWTTRPTWPANSVASADLLSNVNQPGLYFTLIRWYPGYMSAPHKYVTDRLCVVVSARRRWPPHPSFPRKREAKGRKGFRRPPGPPRG